MSGPRMLLAIGSSDIGGAQRVFVALLRELHKCGHRVSVVLPPGPLVELVRPFAAAIFVVDLKALTSASVVARILRKEKPDLVNTYLTKCGLIFAMANVFVRSKLVCTLLNAITHEALGRFRRSLYPGLYWLLHRASHGIIVNSLQNRHHLLDVARMTPERVHLVYSGIDIERFVNAQEHEESTNRRVVIGAVGRLSPEKGHEYLVRAMAHLGHKDADCIIVGDGPLRGQLEQLATTTGVAPRVRFLGFQSDVAVAMRGMSVVVVPSLNETFGLNIVEAFAMKKVVIASDVGGIPELVQDGVTGFLVTPRDPLALANRIDHVLSHGVEAERVASNAQRLAVATFTTKAMTQNTLAVFARVLSGRGPTCS